jgi:hypothetical protein
MLTPRLVTRREFLKLASSALALTALPPLPLPPDDLTVRPEHRPGQVTAPPKLPLPPDDLAARPEHRLGRVTTWRAWVHSEPHHEAPRVGERRYDAIVNILEEVEGVGQYDHNPIWYRILDGYIYSSWVQPVDYRFNRPTRWIEPPGMLAWVTVPYTDVRARPDPSLRRSYRLYYDAIFRVIDVHVPDEKPRQVWYGLRDGLTWDGVYWAKAEHMRIIPPEELTPLSPQVEDKRILIELDKQRLTCFEGRDEVFATRISSGMPGMVTPLGTHRVLQKVPTTRMIGGEGDDYYDLPGIGFTTYFTRKGVAIHGTYWHNDYGNRRSHGCVNAPTAAAQWIYRWTRPDAPYDKQRVFAGENDATYIEVV